MQSDGERGREVGGKGERTKREVRTYILPNFSQGLDAATTANLADEELASGTSTRTQPSEYRYARNALVAALALISEGKP